MKELNEKEKQEIDYGKKYAIINKGDLCSADLDFMQSKGFELFFHTDGRYEQAKYFFRLSKQQK